MPGLARSNGRRVERTSPPTGRVIAVLDALAARPDDRLSLADIARAADAAPATCLGILNELARAHYVVRRANKSYSLGPAVVGLGRAASQGSALVELVRPHLVRLSTAQQLPCTFSAVLGEDIVVLDSTEVPGGPAGVPGVGQRYAFVPPSGVAFVAWHDDTVVDEWLRKPPFGSGHVDRDRIWRAIEFCRAHGYMVEAGTEEVRRTYDLLAELADHVPDELSARFQVVVARILQTRHLTEEIEPAGRYPVNMVAAPVYAAGGEEVGVLAIYLLDSNALGARVIECTEALLGVTASIAAAIRATPGTI